MCVFLYIWIVLQNNALFCLWIYDCDYVIKTKNIEGEETSIPG